MRFGTLLERAARVTWRQKRLWLLGLFVAGYGTQLQGSGGGGEGAGAATAGASAAATAGSTAGWAPSLPLLVSLVALGVAVAILGLVLHVGSEAGLIAAVAESGSSRTARLGRTFRRGLRHFWPVLGIKFLAAGVAALSLVLLAAPAGILFLVDGPLWAVATLAILDVLLAIPWLVTVYAVYQWSMRVSVLEGVGVGTAITRGWRRIHGRLLDALLMLLAEGLGMLVAGVLAGVALIGAGLVFVVLAVALGGLLDLPTAEGIEMRQILVFLALLLPLALAVAGALGTWRSSVWTLGILQGPSAT